MSAAPRVRTCRIVPSAETARARGQPPDPDAAVFEARVFVRLAGEAAERLCVSYYEDELSFRAEEFVGLTWDECLALYHDRDAAYLRE